MQITTLFGIGDEVVGITKMEEVSYIKCSFCGGEGEIKGKNGETRECPDCYGKRLVRELDSPYIWKIKPGLAIVQITAHKNENDQREFYFCVEKKDKKTGIAWPLRNLFLGEESAQKECDKRNKKEKYMNKLNDEVEKKIKRSKNADS